MKLNEARCYEAELQNKRAGNSTRSVKRIVVAYLEGIRKVRKYV